MVDEKTPDTAHRYPWKTRERAMLLYFKGKTKREISQELGVSDFALSTWVRGAPHGQPEDPMRSWRIMRQTLSNSVGEMYNDAKELLLKQVVGLSMKMVRDALYVRYMNTLPESEGGKDKHITIYEARAITDIISAFDKIQRLDVGDPTDIHSVGVAMTLDEVKAAMHRDPFIVMNKEDVKDGNGNKPIGRDEETGRFTVYPVEAIREHYGSPQLEAEKQRASESSGADASPTLQHTSGERRLPNESDKAGSGTERVHSESKDDLTRAILDEVHQSDDEDE